ncbi:MAG: acyl-CoA dehydratase activase [Firmicutes bacterium]|nr:acyl-CoA dehydratase activase [Bacillota bacterium]MCL2177579.1 acyl-CoA dehydratase activase [Bacillota bacterium]
MKNNLHDNSNSDYSNNNSTTNDNSYYLGLDIGSISTKGVLIDSGGAIVRSEYIWTEGNPINAAKEVVVSLLGGSLQGTENLGERADFNVVGVGTTGSARKLVGAMLNADIVKNEITAHALGTLSHYPDAKTIIEIGGQDSKIILLDNGLVVDYAMNTLCAAGTGSFLSSQAKRLGVEVEKFGDVALNSTSPATIAARCTVFAESDLVHKAQMGYRKEDIIAGLCIAVATNYLNNLAKGKKIKPPIVFQGGVSKNAGVIKAFEDALGAKIHVHDKGHLMGAYGVAALCIKKKVNKPFNKNLLNQQFNSSSTNCTICPNACPLVNIYRNNTLLDTYGKRCE